MIGFHLKAGDEKTLRALREIDKGAGSEGIWMRGNEFERWLNMLEVTGASLDFTAESREMSEQEFYGLGSDVLASFGITL